MCMLQLPAPPLEYYQKHREKTKGSSVLMLVGTGWGSGYYFSRIKDRLLKKNKKTLARICKLEGVRAVTDTHIHVYFDIIIHAPQWNELFPRWTWV